MKLSNNELKIFYKYGEKGERVNIELDQAIENVLYIYRFKFQHSRFNFKTGIREISFTHVKNSKETL